MYIQSDILPEIFTHAAAGSLPTLTSIRVSHVCSQWRLVALSISRLWNHFDYSLGIPIAKLQMSRVSPNVPISLRISGWDILDSDSHSEREYKMVRCPIQRWLTEAQIITFPRWNSLYLKLSGGGQRESVVKFFDMLSDRDDELDSLVIRLPNDLRSIPLNATLAKLRFRPRHFGLASWDFPITELLEPLNHASSLYYEGWRRMTLTWLPPDHFTLPRLSHVIFRNSAAVDLSGIVIAPSLTSIYLHKSLQVFPGTALVSLKPDMIHEFAPGLQHLQIIDIHSHLLLWMVPRCSLPSLLTLSVGRCDCPGGNEKSLVRALVNMDMSSTFPMLQKLTLQCVPTPSLEFEELLQSLPASTATFILIRCPQSNTISTDLMRGTHGINLSIQLSDGDLDSDWNFVNSGSTTGVGRGGQE